MTMRIGFNVRKLRGVHGYEWQGELVIPRELVELATGETALRRTMRIRGAPAPNELQALLNAADYAERKADELPDQVLPTRAASNLKEIMQRAAAEQGNGDGSSPKDKLKKVGKGAVKIGKKLFGALF